ncbi:helix-turn-helix domain-containing protein [Winogradskyella undariae]|uniref:helix-turn-helix domain-containing protein n=1 Tax=Winogradskyella TaxID=286104 RepID=UPI00156B57B1|nr:MULTISPECIES: helix-turn-helix domain-containing protein [Winogradskyella]NRR92833.1 helix-turn-helix domain-containing protein [Winogradskyella undariae]QXP79205.1 helix-turn-helix domain-containing protein [Winogradskyella sp. HaHa_3_26]
MSKQNKNQPVQQNFHIELEAHLLENEIWLTTEEAMAYLKISRSTIYRLRKQQSIPNFKLGHSPMYPKHLLTKILMQRVIRNVKQF